MGDSLKSGRLEFARFGEHYNRTLGPFLQSLESERKKRFTTGVIVAVVLIPVSLFLSWQLYQYGVAGEGRQSGRAFILALFLPFILPALGFSLPMAALRKKTKLHMAEDMSGFLGWEHSSREDSKDLARLLYDFDVVPKYKYASTDDILRGHHEYWPFTLREMTLVKIKGWGHSRRAVSVFKGLVLSFAVRPTISGEAVITRSAASGHPRNRPTIRREGVIDSPNGRIIIRASSERIMRTVLCERFQSALIELDAKVPSMDLACVLHENELHIPITSEDLFEIDWLVDKMDTKIRVQKMLNEFGNVLELLDVFLKPRHCSQTGFPKVPEFRYLTPED